MLIIYNPHEVVLKLFFLLIGPIDKRSTKFKILIRSNSVDFFNKNLSLQVRNECRTRNSNPQLYKYRFNFDQRGLVCDRQIVSRIYRLFLGDVRY